MDKIAYSLLITGVGIISVIYGKSIKGYFKGQFLGMGYIFLVGGIIYTMLALLNLFPPSVTNQQQTNINKITTKTAAPVTIYAAPSNGNNTKQSDSLMQHVIDSISKAN